MPDERPERGEADGEIVQHVMPSDGRDVVVPDPELQRTHDIALAALAEITPASTIGAAAGYTVEEGGAISLRFASTQLGYPGWFWTVTVAQVADAEPTVLEVELLPGDGALLAPEWVPWAVRLADYQAQAAAEAAEAADDDSDDDLDDADDDDESDEDDDESEDDDSDDDELDDVDDVDESEFETDASPILHSGDVDGVDIDELDEDAPDDDSDEEDSDEEDPDEDDSDDDGSDDDDADRV